MSDTDEFATLSLKPELLGNLADLGYSSMTTVQAQTLPEMLAGKDVLACAKTGSGKTAAFGLAVLNKLDVSAFHTQTLVLCPTRELADQVAVEFRRLARAIPNVKVLSLCGGVPMGPQIGSLRHSPHIVVGTPGRILKHLTSKRLDLKNVQTLVLDEADRMLDMGFTDEVEEILTFVPAVRQTLLFSATYPPAIAEISERVQTNAVMVDVSEDEQPVLITQYWCSVAWQDRCAELEKVLRAWGGALNLVFCNTKRDCNQLLTFLQAQNIAAVALHGDLDQVHRTEVLTRFANRSASVLIATDVAARGLDVKDLDVVFNFELPDQPEVYVHRIGRTARAGKKGLAVSLVTEREMRRLMAIEEMLPDAGLKNHDIPDGTNSNPALLPEMTTIYLNGGRKDKLRPGDLLGVLTAAGGIPGDAVGSIDLFDKYGYVAVKNAHLRAALRQLGGRKIKGRQYRARVSGGTF